MITALLYTLLVGIIGIAAGECFGRNLARKGVVLSGSLSFRAIPVLGIIFLIFLCALTLLVAILRNQNLLWNLPPFLQLIVPEILHVVLIFCAVFKLGLWRAGGGHSRLSNTGITLLFMSLLMAVIGRTHFPIAGTLHDFRTDQGVIMQSGSSSCAAASLANILQLFGMDKSEKEVARILGTTASGTSPAHTLRGIQKLGLHAQYVRISSRDLQARNQPAILLVERSGNGADHAIALMGTQQGMFDIIDPLSGRTLVHPLALEQEWRGHAILITPPKPHLKAPH